MRRPNMPSPYFRKDTSMWCISYHDPKIGSRKRETVGTRKQDAVKRASQVYQQLLAEYLGEPDAGREDISLETLIDEFFQSKERRTEAVTIKSYRAKARYLLQFMKSKFPSIKSIRQVKTVYLEEFLQSRFKEGKAHRTVEADMQVVKALFNFAVERGYLKQNPASLIKPFKNPNQAKRVQYWTEEEVRQILAEIKPGWRDAHEFLYHTGLRKGELMHLTWGDVSLDADEPHIVIQAKKGWKPKNNKVREVPLNQRAVVLIKRQPKDVPEAYVFKGPGGGRQIHRDKIYRELKRALTVLGLPDDGNVHQWRHTFASHLVMAGTGIETVSGLMGHSNLEMTMRYAHLAPNYLRQAVKLLEKNTNLDLWSTDKNGEGREARCQIEPTT